MDEYHERLLSIIERSIFTIIGLSVAVYLLQIVVSLGQGTYGIMLLNGLSVLFVVGAVVLILWVVDNVITLGKTRESRGKTAK